MLVADPLPRYHKIYLVLRQQIEQGYFENGQVLAGEHALAKQYGVSRITLRRAFDLLEKDQLISRRRGVGTIVLRENSRGGDPMSAVLRDIAKMGATTEVRLLSYVRLPALGLVAERLGLPVRTAVLKTERIRSRNGVPFAFLTAWLPDAVSETMTRDEIGSQSMIGLIQRRFTIVRAENRISAGLADSAVGAALQVEVGSPLISNRRVIYDSNDLPLQYLEALYRPDRHELLVTLPGETQLGAMSWGPI